MANQKAASFRSGSDDTGTVRADRGIGAVFFFAVLGDHDDDGHHNDDKQGAENQQACFVFHNRTLLLTHEWNETIVKPDGDRFRYMIISQTRRS